MEPARVADLPDRHVVPLTGIVAVQHRELARSHVGGRIGREQEPVELVRRLPLLGLCEPDVSLAGMVQDIVHVNLDPPGVGRVDQPLEIRLRPVFRAHGRIVLHIIPMVGIGRMGGRQPDGGDAEGVEVIQPGGDPVEIADPVAVAVGEAVDQQLVGDMAGFLSAFIRGDRRDDIRCRLGARGGEKGRQNRAKEGQTFHRVFELETCRPVRGGRLKIPGMNYLTVTVPALKSMVIVCPAVTLTRSWSPPAPRYAILPSK